MNLSLFYPFILNKNEIISFIIIFILLIYYHKTTKIFKSIQKNLLCKYDKKNSIEKVIQKNYIFENDNNNDDENENEKDNDDEKENNNDNENNKKENKFINECLNKNDENKNCNNIDKKIPNIKIVSNKKNKNDTFNHLEFTPYPNNRRDIKKNYSEKPENHDFNINVNQSVCSTPIFSLRTYSGIDFYFNFLIHDYNSKKIHNLIMCKDIHKWMTNSSLSDEDISNELVPVYFGIKLKDKVEIFEYLKIFIHGNEEGKIAFIQKGNDYIIIEKYTDLLIEQEIILDLLDSKLYNSFNLSSNEGVTEFLNKFLSLVLISENSIGEKVKLDIENYYENKSTYEYFFNTVNADSSSFNTTI